MVKKLVTQWHVIKRRVSLGMSQISHLVGLPLRLYNLILEARVSAKFQTILPPKHDKVAWTSTDSYCNPFRPLPNCRSFKIRVGSWDPLLALLGLSKRLNTEIDILPYSNRHMNRYAEYQIIRLNKLRDQKEAKAFWTLACRLMHSNTFRVMAINHVFPQWQRHKRLSSVLSWAKKASKILRDLEHAHSWDARINFARKYIKKPDGTWRPLGVPTPAWRIALHLWAQMFSIWTHTWMPKSQHGFISGRGTLTAWRDLLSRINSAPHIYEYDLSDWFNKVQHEYVDHCLANFLSVPKWIVERFSQLNNSIPTFKGEEKLDESQYQERRKYFIDPLARYGVGSAKSERSFPSQFTVYPVVSGARDSWGSEPAQSWALKQPAPGATNEMWIAFYEKSQALAAKFPKPAPKPRPKDGITRRLDIWNRWPPVKGVNLSSQEVTVWDRNNRVGLPQGAATSPVLSNVALKRAIYDRLGCVLGYADDGLCFPSTSVEKPRVSHQGAGAFEKEGGRWVKKNGVWLTSLKFLGMEYDPFRNILKASTRKGSKLELELKSEGMDLETVIREFDIRHGLYHPNPSQSWEMMIKSNLAGWIQSRLYSGYWSTDSIFQDFSYTFASQSWSNKIGGKCDATVKVGLFNSSSVASAWLAAQLSGGSNKNKARDIFGRRLATGKTYHQVSLYGKE